VCEPTASFDDAFRSWKSDSDPQFLIRVTHSSGMLEGKYTIDTKFDADDHRSHRPRAWLVEGLQKVEKLQPFCDARNITIGQLALLWLYAHRSIVCALPNIYDEMQLKEFVSASQHPALSDEEMEEIHQLYIRNFDVTPYLETAVTA
jgi:aryl-alcohol dehydrogenase-like predicted oxidoreductase